MEDNEPKVSKYNSGINIIMRLDALWRETHKAVKEGKYYDWNLWLDRIWCELARDLSEDEFNGKIKNNVVAEEGYKSKFDKLDSKIFENGKIVDSDEQIQGFQTINNKDILEKRNKQYKALMEKDLFLRRLENHLGKGTAWDDEDEDDFD